MSGGRERLVAAALGVQDVTLQPLAGGCVSDVCLVRADSGDEVVAKFGNHAILEEESHGLSALGSTDTVRVPFVHGVHGEGRDACLLLEHLQGGGQPDWGAFGRSLAALHASDVGERYGFDRDNHLGPTFQPNEWMDDWRAFNRARRHGPIVEVLCQRGVLGGRDLDAVRRALDAFDDVLPEHPRPALLHGDLWSGNALPLDDGTVAVIDPAPSVGDPLADIGMMQLFGGFPEPCFRAYFEVGEEEPAARRLAAYRLYHMLNHLLIFGGSYLGGVLRESTIVSGER